MMRKEKLKSGLVVLLFIISLGLTQRLWFYLPFNSIISLANNTDVEKIDIDVTDILSPQSFIISFGGGYHTVFFSEPYEVWNITRPEEKKEVLIWKTVKSVLREYFANSYDIEEIPMEEWKKIKKFKSIRMNFACEIPGDSFISALGGNNEKVNASINTVLIAVTEEERKNIYFGNYEENRYFKLIGSSMDNKVRTLIENIERSIDEKGYSYDYVSLKDFAEVNNDVLAPLFNQTYIPIFSSVNQIDVSDNDMRSIAHQFFGRSFDFVKEITEIDGTYIYIYGYGEKTLKIDNNGILEYIEKDNREVTSSELGFLDSLKYAAKFVGDKIDWPVNIENAYLSHYEEINKNNKKGYRFSFNYRLNGVPVFVPDIGKDRGIEVEIIGNQVTNYRRIVKRKGEEIESEEYKKQGVLNILDVLTKQSSNIKNNYIKFCGKQLSQDEIDGLKIEELIENIELYYYLDKNDILKPVWEITIDNKVYYIDVYTGVIDTLDNKQ